MSKHPAVLIVAIVAFVFVSACDKSGGSAEEGAQAQAAESEESEHHHEGEHEHEGHHDDHQGEGAHDHAKNEEETADQREETVEVPADGKEFEPSVHVSKIPEGAWHCNMNDEVHYAAMEKGDGKCPVCSMKLHEK